MASAVAPLVVEPGDARAPPRPIVVCGIALLGGVAAVVSFNLSLAGDYGPAPYVHAGIVAWITLSYVLCGLIAWWRRPESQFGPLLIAAGFAPALSQTGTCEQRCPPDDWGGPAPATSRALPPCLSRLSLWTAGAKAGSFPRRSPATQLSSASMFCEDCSRVTGLDSGANGARAAQRVTVAVVVLGGLGALVWRRRKSARIGRHSRELLAACFGLALIGLGAGMVMLTLGAPGTDVARVIAFGLVGIAPILFLIGHLRARLARSAVGDLFVDLGPIPPRRASRRACARAPRSVAEARLLAAGVRELRRPGRAGGRSCRSRARAGR